VGLLGDAYIYLDYKLVDVPETGQGRLDYHCVEIRRSNDEVIEAFNSGDADLDLENARKAMRNTSAQEHHSVRDFYLLRATPPKNRFDIEITRQIRSLSESG
jgi:hypothetical protein